MSIKRLVSANYRFIKGQLGEAVTERLFASLNMHICRYGYEVTTPSVLLLRQQGKVSKAAIKRISHHPDFIVIKPADVNFPEGQAFKIEVKYSYYSRIDFDDLLNYDDDVYFLLLDNQNFWIANRSELEILKKNKKTASFAFKDITLLENYSVFNFSKNQVNTICAFKRFLESTFGNLSKHGDVIETVEKDFEGVWKQLRENQTNEQFSELDEYFEDPDLEFNPKVAKLAVERDLPQNAGQEWTEIADKELLEKYETLKNLDLKEAIKILSQYFQRSSGAIRSRLTKLEVIENDGESTCTQVRQLFQLLLVRPNYQTFYR